MMKEVREYNLLLRMLIFRLSLLVGVTDNLLHALDWVDSTMIEFGIRSLERKAVSVP